MKTADSPAKLYGLVLAGGLSSRMKKDKGGLVFHDQDQCHYCFSLLATFCERVFVSNRKEQEELPYHKGLPQIHDHEDYKSSGPLAGILAAQKQHPQVAWLVLACDLPFVDRGIIQHLIKHRCPQNVATAYASFAKNLPEPLCAIYEPQAYPILNDFFRKGVKCPREILKLAGVPLLVLPQASALVNVNTLDEYREARLRLRSS